MMDYGAGLEGPADGLRRAGWTTPPASGRTTEVGGTVEPRALDGAGAAPPARFSAWLDGRPGPLFGDLAGEGRGMADGRRSRPD